ncbi:Uncharacterised protein [Mycobacteroides abscessus]|nr:Uncharacterised protein [Mycobacteroides abscessus]
MATPFGVPVVPEVKMMYAMSSGVGPGGAVSACTSGEGSLISIMHSSMSPRRDRCSVVVTARIGAVSATMNSMRAKGSAGSTGT